MGLTARVVAAAAAGFALALPSAAWADADAAIVPGDVPATAQQVGRMCATAFGGGPLAGQDVWMFELADTQRDFVSLVAHFSTDANLTVDTSLPAPANGGIADANGTSTAWILAPAGATLISASATVTGNPHVENVTFTLAHTCPASGQPTASASPSPTGAAGPSASTQPSASTKPLGGGGARSASPSVTPLGDAMPTPTAASLGGLGGRPNSTIGPEAGVNGAILAGRILVGGGSALAAAVGAGLFLVMARRRRHLA